MFRFLLLACVAVTCMAEEVEPAESGTFIHRGDDHHRDERERYDPHRLHHNDDHHRNHHADDRQQNFRLNLHDDDHFRGPAILRSTGVHNTHGHGPDIAKQNKIIEDAFSPDYYQPTWILDYRYMKTGGRDYTRSPGGQYIILPKNVHTDEHKEFRDYDSLLEHLRLKNLAEKNEMRERFRAEYEGLKKESRH